MPNRTERHRLRRRAAFVAATLLPLASACGHVGIAGRTEHPERLDGEWTVEFRLEHPATLTRDTSGLVRGTVVLLESGQAGAVAGLSGAPTHYGVYAANLRPLGLRGGGGVPALAARLGGADSVEIAFGPEQGHAFVGRGTLAGDSVIGHWWTEGGRTTGRGSGRFVMRRR
jgi:hypothetical protein